jgi:hypothetical protein
MFLLFRKVTSWSASSKGLARSKIKLFETFLGEIKFHFNKLLVGIKTCQWLEKIYKLLFINV